MNNVFDAIRKAMTEGIPICHSSWPSYMRIQYKDHMWYRLLENDQKVQLREHEPFFSMNDLLTGYWCKWEVNMPLNKTLNEYPVQEKEKWDQFPGEPKRVTLEELEKAKAIVADTSPANLPPPTHIVDMDIGGTTVDAGPVPQQQYDADTAEVCGNCRYFVSNEGRGPSFCRLLHVDVENGGFRQFPVGADSMCQHTEYEWREPYTENGK